MKTTELMRGNFVLWHNVTVEVDLIADDIIRILYKDSFIDNVIIEDIKPVRLTTSIIKDLGFEISCDKYGWVPGMTATYENIILTKPIVRSYWNYSYTNNYDEEFNTDVEIEFIHQLQNMAFILNNIKLKFT